LTAGDVATAPIEVMQKIAEGSASLDALGKAMDAAVEEYNAADEEWLRLYDDVGASLAEDYRASGRKTDPAEHTITAETRRQHRAAYMRWKRAKRDVERIRAATAATNGRQSQLGALRDELRAETFAR
jgi:hypothetical protein